MEASVASRYRRECYACQPRRAFAALNNFRWVRQAGLIKGGDDFVIKVAAGGFSKNASLTPPLPPNSGAMLVFSQRTGMLKGVLLDEGYLTELRTAAAGALAARWAVRVDTSVALALCLRIRGMGWCACAQRARPTGGAVHWHRGERCAGAVSTIPAAWCDDMPPSHGVGAVG